MNDLMEVCGDLELDYSQISYLIGSEIFPSHLIRYRNGAVLIDDLVVESLIGAMEIAEISELGMIDIILGMMKTEGKRWYSQMTDSCI